MKNRQAALLLRCTLLLLVPALITPPSQQAQDSSGSVEGVAVDANGAVIPNVSVTIYCDCKECPEVSCDACCPESFSRLATSDDKGRFRIADLRPGVYSLRGDATGFAPVKLSGVKVSAHATESVTLTFDTGGDPSRVEVQAPAAAAPASERATPPGTSSPSDAGQDKRKDSAATVQVEVIDEANDNKPVAGARVTLMGRCDCRLECPNEPCDTCCPTFTLVTNARGTFTVNAPPGHYSGLAVVGPYTKNFSLQIPEKGKRRFAVAMSLGQQADAAP